VIALFAALAFAVAPDCAADRAAMLALPRHVFDQAHEGWRALAERGCDAAAADLIAAYRAGHLNDPPILGWHEGQMRANAGDYAAARPLFVAAHHAGQFGWNDYVDATIAFIDRDRDLAALLAARMRLAATPRPETHPWFDPDGNPIPPPATATATATAIAMATTEAWPPNLLVVDALVRCFDRAYKAAYMSADCAAT